MLQPPPQLAMLDLSADLLNTLLKHCVSLITHHNIPRNS